MNQQLTKPFVVVDLRWMITRDWTEVLEIEKLSFDTPWDEDNLRACLREKNCIGMVAEKGGIVAGFCIYELNRHSLRILNFAVHPHFRRHGVGSQMVWKLKSKIYPTPRRCRINVVVRESELPAQLFFKDHGFKWVRTLDYGGVECYLMRWGRPAPEDPIKVLIGE